MPDMHLPYIPGHIRWGPGDFETLIDAAAMDFVDIVNPDRHPHSPVTFFITFRTERHSVRPFAAAALSTFAEKDLTIAGTHTTERWRTPPLPGFLPSEFLKPRETLFDIGDVQNRRQAFCEHDSL